MQWGYKMQCADNTLDYPCTVSVIGTAIISSTTASASTSGCGYVNCCSPYFQMVGFIGTRTFYNRYGQAYVQNISMAQIGEDYADQLLYLQAPYTDGNGLTFYLNGTDGALTQFPGGLFGNEINIYLDPYATETLAVSGGPSNALYYDPSLPCSAPPRRASRPTRTARPHRPTPLAAPPWPPVRAASTRRRTLPPDRHRPARVQLRYSRQRCHLDCHRHRHAVH